MVDERTTGIFSVPLHLPNDMSIPTNANYALPLETYPQKEKEKHSDDMEARNISGNQDKSGYNHHVHSNTRKLPNKTGFLIKVRN